MQNNNLEQINKEAKEIAEIVAKKYKPEKIILFGSVARGEIRKDSDIDLCIIKKTKLPFRKRICKIYDLIDNVDSEHGVEPVIFTPKEFKEREETNYFIRNILKDGKILYEAAG